MIAWDEVTHYAPEGSMVQAWRRHKFAGEAAQKGLDSVVSPVSHCYIDYPQLQFTMKNLYHFEPIPEGLSPDLHHHVLGGEVNLWSERVTLANIDKKAFPRVMAHSEVMWSPAEKRDWESFTVRLRVVKKEWENKGVEFGITWRDVAGLL
jgi:hexosaminidase